MRPPKKPTACIPCHTRKVRCDATRVGTPCTRCVDKGRVSICILRLRSGKSVEEADTRLMHKTSNERRRTPCATEQHSDEITCESFQQAEVARATKPTLCAPCPASYPSSRLLRPNNRPTPNELAQSWDNVTGYNVDLLANASRSPSLQPPPKSSDRRVIVEYYNVFNPGTILNESLGQPKRQGLVETETITSCFVSAQERELSFLDPVDRAYILERGVYNMPSAEVCDAFIHLFFQNLYTYSPILDQSRFLADYNRGSCSTFLLYALFVVVVPYTSPDLLRLTGYDDIIEAQAVFSTRARLLYDFGCERRELILLQGSVLLCSFQHSLNPNKSFRFWFSSATRLATQMGLHKFDTGAEADPTTRRSCQRIWWVLVQRDIFLVIAGLETTRRLVDEESDNIPLGPDAFQEEPLDDETHVIDSLTSRLQMQYFVESCKLSLIGARFLRLFHVNEASPTLVQVKELCDTIETLRLALPKELTLQLDKTWNHANACVVMMHTFRCQLQFMIHRTVRQRLSVLDHEALLWNSQQLLKAMSEASSLLRQAMMDDIIRHMPPLLMDCVSQLAAIQYETMQSSTCTAGRKLSLRNDLYLCLSYFEDAGNKWESGQIYYKLFRLALDKQQC